jgi:hypothetical protein
LKRAVYQGEAQWLVGNAGPRGRSPQTVAVFMSSLGKVLKYATRALAADARALAEFRYCSFAAESKVRGRALEADEITSLLAAAAAARWPHWGLLVRLLLTTAGARATFWSAVGVTLTWKPALSPFRSPRTATRSNVRDR